MRLKDGVEIRLDYLPGKHSYKHEVYLIDRKKGRSGVLESFQTKEQAKKYRDNWIKKELPKFYKMYR